MKSVTVIVATYRRDVSLKRALESLAAQTYSNMDIVLVDDNGEPYWNDKVAAIVKEFKDSNPDIPLKCIVNPQNYGSAKTRNIGIEAADGEYITFLDDDDIYLPNKVKDQAEFMKKGEYDYSITDLILYDDSGKVIDKRIRDYIKDTSAKSLRRYHLKYSMTGTDTVMFKKEYIVKIGGLALVAYGDEYYLIQRAIDGGGKFGYFHGCGVKAYVHKGENGLSSGQSRIDGEREMYKYKKTFFKELKLFERRYIRMRHFAVLAFAYIRIGNKIKFIKYGILSAMCAPLACVKLLIKRKA